MADFIFRIEKFLASRGEDPADVTQLTPDASTREYFRVGWQRGTAIACVYPEPFRAAEQSYLDVSALFLSCSLPVAAIFDQDEALGVIVMEDLGDRILRDEMARSPEQRREELFGSAISLIPRIQASTMAAVESGSIAARLKFDVEKLVWELGFFKEHYFTTLNRRPMAEELSNSVEAEFLQISRELEARASVLCHRDFHAANLMLDSSDMLRIIDHQDARIGTAAYDLVSLLLDRVTAPPTPEWLAQKRREFLGKRVEIGLPALDENDFANEFRLQTVQRCLKAIGTFSFQSANRGKTHFLPFIPPMFEIVFRALENLQKFPAINAMVEAELNGFGD